MSGLTLAPRPCPAFRVRAAVSSLDAAAQFLSAGRWNPQASALSPGTLRVMYPDARWECTLVTAVLAGRPAGYLAVHRLRFRCLPNPAYDVGRVMGLPDAAGRYAYLGGRHDLVAGAVLAEELDAVDGSAVRRALVDRARAEVESAGLTPAALYVPDGEVADFAAGLGPACVMRELGSAAVLDIAGHGPLGYPAGLRRSRRQRIRQEQRRLAALALDVTEVPAADAVVAGAPMIVSVGRGHGVQDHPRLVARRLRQWMGCGAGEHVAFEVRTPNRDLLALSFACRAGTRLEVYELGLVPVHPHRHLAYAAAAVHGPVRHGERHGCATVHLGLGSSAPKVLRGAHLTSVWGLTIPSRKG